METTMMYPAAYCVMTEEEMTYTEGGANLLQAVCAVAVPVYGWLAGVSAIRDYRKAHPTSRLVCKDPMFFLSAFISRK